jgi:hypothetical protein
MTDRTAIEARVAALELATATLETKLVETLVALDRVVKMMGRLNEQDGRLAEAIETLAGPPIGVQ